MKNIIFLTFFLLTVFSVSSLEAQYQPIDNIQILQLPIFEASDSNLVIDYSIDWLVGYNVYYKCLINKADSVELNNIMLIVSNEVDTLFNNNYYINSSDPNLLIEDNGLSAIINIDTLIYSSEYIFSLSVLDNEGDVIQEIIHSENSN